MDLASAFRSRAVTHNKNVDAMTKNAKTGWGSPEEAPHPWYFHLFRVVALGAAALILATVGFILFILLIYGW
jgi:hypothetical protein